MRKIVQSVTIIFILCGISCQSSPTCEDGYAISASARNGCRSPAAQGCATCCVSMANGCSVRTFVPERSGTTAVPWYNSKEYRSACPANCAPCALCSLHDEEDLCQILKQPYDCVCGSQQSNVDPCRNPQSCECYCLLYNQLTSMCPSG